MGVLRETENDEPNPKKQRVEQDPWSKYLRVGQRRLADNLQQVQTIPGLHLSPQRGLDLALPLNRGIYTYLWGQGGDSKTVAETYKNLIRGITDMWGARMTDDLDRLREGYVSGTHSVEEVLARLLDDPEAPRIIHRPLPPDAPPFRIEPLERGAAGAGAGTGAGIPNPGVATGVLQSAAGAGGARAGEREGERGTAVAAAQVRANAVGLGHPGHPVNGAGGRASVAELALAGFQAAARAEGSGEAGDFGPHVGVGHYRDSHSKPRSVSPSPPALTAAPGRRPQAPAPLPGEASSGIHASPPAAPAAPGAVPSPGRLEPPEPSANLQAPALPPCPAQLQLPPPPPPPPPHVLEPRLLPAHNGARALSSDPAVKASPPPPLDQTAPARSTEWNPYGPADPAPSAPLAEAQIPRQAPPVSSSPTLSDESPLRQDRGTGPRRNPQAPTPVTPAEQKPVFMSGPEPGEIMAQDAVLTPADALYRTRIEALEQLIGSVRRVSSLGGPGLSDIKRAAQKRQREHEPILDRQAQYDSDVRAVEQRRAELLEREQRLAELEAALAFLDREAEQDRAAEAARHAETMRALKARAHESEQQLFKIMAEDNVKDGKSD